MTSQTRPHPDMAPADPVKGKQHRGWGRPVQTLGARVVEALRATAAHPILPFHAAFIEAAYSPGIEIAALSCPRGSAKTWIAAELAKLAMTPGSPTWEPNIEVLVVSASFEQSRILLAMVKASMGEAEADYRWLDSGQRLACTHKATGTKLRVLSSSGKRAMGLSQFSTILADEPASWEVKGGALMFDALRQSLGKRPGQRLFLIGTRAPALPHTWWPDLLDAGSGPGKHVQVLTAPAGEPWDTWDVIAKVNPVATVSESLRATILRERDEARRNPTMRRAFEAYRLNRPVDAHSEVLVNLGDWQRAVKRDVPPRSGRPIVGIDMGAERSWSAAWCLWENGRSECFAVVPGIPDLAERERYDAMPPGMYRQLADDGVLVVEEGVRVTSPQTLVDHLVAAGIQPAVVLCDRFLIGALRDAVAGRWTIIQRVTRWSEATEDISAFRRLIVDGPLSIAHECRKLAFVSLSQTAVLSDSQGSVRLRKSRTGRSRDDVAVAGVLAAGAYERGARVPVPRQRRFAVAR